MRLLLRMHGRHLHLLKLRPLRLQTLTSEQQSFTVATTSVEGFEEQPQLLMPAGGLVVFWAE